MRSDGVPDSRLSSPPPPPPLPFQVPPGPVLHALKARVCVIFAREILKGLTCLCSRTCRVPMVEPGEAVALKCFFLYFFFSGGHYQEFLIRSVTPFLRLIPFLLTLRPRHPVLPSPPPPYPPSNLATPLTHLSCFAPLFRYPDPPSRSPGKCRHPPSSNVPWATFFFSLQVHNAPPPSNF